MVGFPPKSSILIGFSIIFTIHFGVPLFLETPMSCHPVGCCSFIKGVGLPGAKRPKWPYEAVAAVVAKSGRKTWEAKWGFSEVQDDGKIHIDKSSPWYTIISYSRLFLWRQCRSIFGSRECLDGTEFCVWWHVNDSNMRLWNLGACGWWRRLAWQPILPSRVKGDFLYLRSCVF